MQIASIILAHNNPELIKDTIDSIRTWVTKNIVLVIDKAGWHNFEDFSHPDTHIICGLHHGIARSPYKNVIIGMKEAYRIFPAVDWYCCTEFDTLFLSDSFKKDLEKAQGKEASAVGIEYLEKNDNDNWLIKEIFNKPDLKCFKMLGCLMFFSGKCFRGWEKHNFFDQLLELTKGYKGEKIPNFHEFSVDEVIFPCAASIFGPVVSLKNPCFAGYNGNRYEVYFGDVCYNGKRYEEILPEHIKPCTSVIHPVKRLDNPIRKFCQETRKSFLC